PLIQHIVDRLGQATFVDKIIVATTNEALDDPLVHYLNQQKIPCFRGATQDVLARFYECAQRYPSDIIVRVTADDPFKESEIIDKAISFLKADPLLDYCSNTLFPTYPEGLDIEVFRIDALKRAYREAVLSSEREHVTPYIWKYPEKFKIHNFNYKENLSHWRWTIDYEKDFEFTQKIYAELYPKFKNKFSYEDVISLLKDHPELMEINKGVQRNEGYLNAIHGEQK
ncbi:MAG: glycosyltransferase family protein, partial [Legionella sp.]|nr:glycosyltransferase family protein [Legionella sp.]